MDKPQSKVIALRVNTESYRRLSLRAIRNRTSVGKYLKTFIEKDLYRNTGLHGKARVDIITID